MIVPKFSDSGALVWFETQPTIETHTLRAAAATRHHILEIHASGPRFRAAVTDLEGAILKTRFGATVEAAMREAEATAATLARIAAGRERVARRLRWAEETTRRIRRDAAAVELAPWSGPLTDPVPAVVPARRRAR